MTDEDRLPRILTDEINSSKQDLDSPLKKHYISGSSATHLWTSLVLIFLKLAKNVAEWTLHEISNSLINSLYPNGTSMFFSAITQQGIVTSMTLTTNVYEVHIGKLRLGFLSRWFLSTNQWMKHSFKIESETGKTCSSSSSSIDQLGILKVQII